MNRKKEIGIKSREMDLRTKNRIETAILEHLCISMGDMVSRSKKREISYARDIYCYFMRKRTNFPHKIIGRFLNGRSHTTIIDSENNIKELLDVYQKVRDDLREIDELVKVRGIMVG